MRSPYPRAPTQATPKVNPTASAASAGEFSHWSDERRDERIALFFSLIEKYATIGINSVVPLKVYQIVFGKRISKELKHLKHPNYILLFGVVHSIAHHFARIGHTEPIDFIFDGQPEQVQRITESWEILRIVGDPKLRHLVANPPIFRDDKTTMPLQAADLSTWWHHQSLIRCVAETAVASSSLSGQKNCSERTASPVLLDGRPSYKNAQRNHHRRSNESHFSFVDFRFSGAIFLNARSKASSSSAPTSSAVSMICSVVCGPPADKGKGVC